MKNKNEKFELIADDKHCFSLDLNLLKQADIQSNGKGQFHIIKNQKSFNVELIYYNELDKYVVLSVEGRKITYHIKDSLDILVEKMGFNIRVLENTNEIFSPMPGLVFDIKVVEGSSVSIGESVIILEAMKMENIIKAPNDGIIKTIHVEKGQAVEKGQILIELE